MADPKPIEQRVERLLRPLAVDVLRLERELEEAVRVRYHQATEGQELELTGQPPGIYYLVTTSTNYDNNTAWASFRLKRDSKGNPKVEPVGHSPCVGTLCSAGPNR